MSLTAREWLLLPEKEQQEKGHELSPHECFLLRTSYAYIHFKEEEKQKMSEEEKDRFLHPPKKELSETDKKMAKMSITEQIEYIFGKNK